MTMLAYTKRYLRWYSTHGTAMDVVTVIREGAEEDAANDTWKSVKRREYNAGRLYADIYLKTRLGI